MFLSSISFFSFRRPSDEKIYSILDSGKKIVSIRRKFEDSPYQIDSDIIIIQKEIFQIWKCLTSIKEKGLPVTSKWVSNRFYFDKISNDFLASIPIIEIDKGFNSSIKIYANGFVNFSNDKSSNFYLLKDITKSEKDKEIIRDLNNFFENIQMHIHLIQIQIELGN